MSLATNRMGQAIEAGRLLAIMGQQRSGTHLLGSLLGSHTDIKYTGERLGKGAPIWERLAQIVVRNMGGFPGFVCLDVKYNHITEPVEELLRQIPVIHLIRRDVRRLCFSGMLHTYYGEHPEDRGKVIPVLKKDAGYDEVVANVKAYIERFSYLEDLRVYYEDLTGGREIRQLSDLQSYRLCEFVGVPFQVLTTGCLKEAPVDIDEYFIE